MNDEELIGYLFDALSPEEREAVASRLQTDSDAANRLEELRISLLPLEADREFAEAPAGLALRTIERLAAHLAEYEPTRGEASDHGTIVAVAAAMDAASPLEDHPLVFPAPLSLRRATRAAPESRAVGGRFRFDVLVACGIAFFAFGLVFSAIGRVRAQHQVLVCQGNLRTLHAGLAGYADTHDGKYPQIGTGTNPTAETFVTALVDSGQVPVGFRPCCPADPSLTDRNALAKSPVGYTYTLGYRSPTGALVGFRQPTAGGEHGLVPISADYPTAEAAPASGPLCPHAIGMNVLYAGGHVRHTTSPFIGPDGDDIYRNFFGKVAAGNGPLDVVLGRPGDQP